MKKASFSMLPAQLCISLTVNTFRVNTFSFKVSRDIEKPRDLGNVPTLDCISLILPWVYCVVYLAVYTLYNGTPSSALDYSDRVAAKLDVTRC